MIRRVLALVAVASLLLASAAVMAKPADNPGNSGNAPGQSQEAPGRSGEAPGHTGENPGHSEDGPGDSSAAPGQTGTAPGKAGVATAGSPEAEVDEADVVGSPEANADGVLEEEPGNSAAAHACQKDGYLQLAPADDADAPFRNTGDCVSYAAQGGELVDVEGDALRASPVASPEVD